jgi:hypothetical protein
MAKGAIAVCLQPRLAQDARIDLTAMLNGVTHENWKASKAKIVAGLKKLSVSTFTSKPAMDAGVQDIVKLLDSLDDEQLGDKPTDGVVKDASADDPDGNAAGNIEAAPSPDVSESPDPAQASRDKITALLQGKISDEDLEQVLQLVGGGAAGGVEAQDDDDATAANATKELLKKMQVGGVGKDVLPVEAAGVSVNGQPAKPANINQNQEKQVEKAAMDQAILKAKNETKLEVTKQLRDIAEAEKIVKPFIGEVLAQDSAEAVYRLALDHHEVDLEGVPPSAYKAMVKMLPLPGAEKSRSSDKQVMAKDSKNAAGVSFKDRYPTAGKVHMLG